ncbi:seryl-tRNA synthetase, mitochondrial [Arctopsyche grandis]|uniref:seryl-tRNA synthetase, mitochondrial n=1 Tax=Arctopsyche grandis TaxID=121162 RepID=UPI00406D6BB0
MLIVQTKIMKNFTNMFKMYNKFTRLYSTFPKHFPEFNFDYLCNENNFEHIKNNIEMRKGVGDIAKVCQLYNDLLNKSIDSTRDKLTNDLNEEAKKIPNETHPDVRKYGTEPKIVKFINEAPTYTDKTYKPFEFSQITRKLHILRTDNLGNFTGHRSYFLIDSLAELEEALLKYSIGNLVKKGFSLVSVPDILPKYLIESCGMIVAGDRPQIYSLDEFHHGPELCLSGTAEMSLAGLLINTTHKAETLPLKMAAVSRCYRAEASSTSEEKGIYRVHQFTKVEMFGVCSPNDSDALLEEFRQIEEESFTELGLHMRVLDMPPYELGAPAYRKYDIEAWMPGRNMFGEISSCSNCTDFQARRLHIKYIPRNQSASEFAHTLNGTACAVPRMLIALLETHQKPNGTILIPEVLRKYMNDETYIKRRKAVPDLKTVKLV